MGVFRWALVLFGLYLAHVMAVAKSGIAHSHIRNEAQYTPNRVKILPGFDGDLPSDHYAGNEHSIDSPV